ncbi:MAG: hypothetical protein WD069_13895 [Planctomycetales bacterium]
MRWIIIAYLIAASPSGHHLAAQLGPNDQLRTEAVQLPALQVEILQPPDEGSVHHHNPVVIRFTNNGDEPVSILRRLDGSEWGWHMPHYRFTVTDANDKPLELPGRCGVSGLWSGPKWPDDYIIEIRPGDSHEMRAGIPHSVPADGEHRVTFEYIYDPQAAPRWRIAYPDGLWSGTAGSKEVRLKLHKSL